MDYNPASLVSMEPTSQRHVLFLCAQNKIRSLTAERMLAGSQVYEVRSRGITPAARIKVTEGDLRWADVIFVMEKNHKERLLREYREVLSGKDVVVLFIKDRYEPMQPELIVELRRKLAPYLGLPKLANEEEMTG